MQPSSPPSALRLLRVASFEMRAALPSLSSQVIAGVAWFVRALPSAAVGGRCAASVSGFGKRRVPGAQLSAPVPAFANPAFNTDCAKSRAAG